MAETRPRLYFNLRSPYSWLTLHDLAVGHSELLDALDWRPYWEPDPATEALLNAAGGRFIYTQMSREKHFYVLADVRRLARDRGLRVRWPIDRAPRWEVSHLAYLEATRWSCGTEFAIAVSRARWEHGRDISDPAVVAEIGAAIGLDPARLATATEDPDLIAAGTRALVDVWRDGAFGVPFFVYGREKFWGLDRLDAFVRSFRQVGPAGQEPVPGTVAMAAGDDGHAGGCG
ncbi:MAG TPA: DsbA family protein [Pseudonocardiaceae bacterium]|nr:DsbA family protein [Pseudonocardiaceae bacterium]